MTFCTNNVYICVFEVAFWPLPFFVFLLTAGQIYFNLHYLSEEEKFEKTELFHA